MTAILPVACVVILGAFVFATYYHLISRMASALVYVAISALFLVSVSESIGKPKPTWSEVRAIDKALLISAVPIYEDKIYLWLLPEGASTPVAYVMPWSIESAQSLQNAMEDATANGTGVMVSRGDAGEDDAPNDTFQFHAEPPQPPSPPKSLIQ